MKEKMIEEHLEGLVFEQFVADAVESHQHYEEAGLHLTQKDVENWAKNLSTKASLPECHK